MPLIYSNSLEQELTSPLKGDLDLEAAIGEGVVASLNEDPHSWVPIEEICNGEWRIGGTY